MNNYYVQIIGYDESEVIKEMGPMGENKAEKVDMGLNINLDHANYFTVVIQKD